MRLGYVPISSESEPFANLQRIEAPQVDLKMVANTHRQEYVDTVMDNVPTEGRVYLDPDTSMSPKSAEAALRAAGGACAAVDAVLSGEARNAFCAVRPPGHHAEAAVLDLGQLQPRPLLRAGSPIGTRSPSATSGRAAAHPRLC